MAQEAESLQYVLAAMHRGPTPAEVALSRLTQIGGRTGINRRLEVALLQTRAELEAMQGRFDAARAVISQAKALTEEHGLYVLLDARIRPAAGAVELLAGDAAAAEQELRLACEGTERLGELGFLSSVAPLLVDALYQQGRDGEALVSSERWRPERLTVPEDADAQIGWRRVRAKVLARTGELDEAERLSREAVAIAAGTDFLDARAEALADLGEVLRLVGRPQESTSALEEAIGLHEDKGNVVAAGRLRRLLAEPSIEV